MEGTEKRMKAKIITDAFFIGQYKIANKYIKDLNKRYEDAKDGLKSYGPRLAGRLDSELEMLPIIQSTDSFPQIVKCMEKHMKQSIEFKFKTLNLNFHTILASDRYTSSLINY